MKKIALLGIIVFSFCFRTFAQNNVSVSIYDDVYELIEQAQLKGLCSTISGAKPYTRQQIFKAINEIYDSGYELSDKEAKILGFYFDKMRANDEMKNNVFHARVKNDNPELPLSFNYNFSFEMVGSMGLYNENSYKNYLFELIPGFTFEGDLTKYFSYNVFAFLDGTKAEFVDMGKYFIGYNWYGDNTASSTGAGNGNLEEFFEGKLDASGNQYNPTKRCINKKLLTSYLPYRYNKH